MNNFIFATIILAMISMVNAKNAYMPCVAIYPSNTLSLVTLSPDPVAGKPYDYTIYTVLDKDVISDDYLEVDIVDDKSNPLSDPFTMDICSSTGIKCPIKALTLIKLSTE
ncbi:12087_t:CDS:1, partial [Funneliformis mosseae]